MRLNKDTLIQRSPNLELDLRDNQIYVRAQGREIRCGYHAFAVLDAFSVPIALQKGLHLLSGRVKGKWDWINLTLEVRRLISHGVLTSDLSVHKRLHSHHARFDAADVHIRMLNDVQRTRKYASALSKVVTEDTVVIDVGAGTGILSALAARAGAKRVYAIEQSTNLAKFASEFFERNGLATKITVVEGVASQVEIPEKGDILVTETIGNDPLDEGLMEICFDGGKRFMKSGGLMMPSSLKILALPVEVPVEVLTRVQITDKLSKSWENLYGLDFTVYRDASQGSESGTYVSAYDLRFWSRLSQPILMANIKLGKDEPQDICLDGSFTVETKGLLNGIFIYFEAELSKGNILSTHPEKVQKTNSWANLLLLPRRAQVVKQGQRVEWKYKFDRLKRKSSIDLDI